jgi:hypothetical protein
VLRPAVRRGTGRGARLGARFTRADHAELELELAEPPEVALRRAADVLREHGSLRDLGRNHAAPTVAAVIPSGFANMNPALVVVAVAPAADGSRVRLEGYALEGLIRQRAAAKAARRVADLLLG